LRMTVGSRFDPISFFVIETQIALHREHTARVLGCAAWLMINLSGTMLYLDLKRGKPEKG
jgi:hypothetical protein